MTKLFAFRSLVVGTMHQNLIDAQNLNLIDSSNPLPFLARNPYLHGGNTYSNDMYNSVMRLDSVVYGQ